MPRVARWYLLAAIIHTQFTGTAKAGPPEFLSQIAVHPTNPERMVLRYENAGTGLVFSHDGGASWQALCGSAMLTPTATTAPRRLLRTSIASDDTVFVGTFTALLRNAGDGCDWVGDPAFEGDWVTDVVQHPGDPEVLFAVTSTAPDGANGILQRDGSGEWKRLGKTENIAIQRVLAASLPSGELRFYQSASRGMIGEPPNAVPNYLVRVSDDLGATWDEYEFGASAGTVTLEAVDPGNPDRIVVTEIFDRVEPDPFSPGADVDLSAPPPHRVLVSDDRGATYREFLTVTQFGGIDFAQDGRLWIGDSGDTFEPDAPSGLYFAESLDDAPSKVESELEVRCIHYSAERNQLFVCQRFDAGWTDLEGADYRLSFAFRSVDDFVDCPDRDLVQSCRMQLRMGWCSVAHFAAAKMCCPYDIPLLDPELAPVDCPDDVTGTPTSVAGADAGPSVRSPGDLGESDAGRPDPSMTFGADAGTAAPDSSGCGCGIAGSHARGPGAWLAALLLALALTRRRKTARARTA